MLLLLLHVLCQIETSKSGYLPNNTMFSGIYYDLNLYLEDYGRQLSYQNRQSEETCLRSRQCVDRYGDSMCDQFFIGKGRYVKDIQSVGYFCVPKPILGNNLGLIADSNSFGLRRCSSYRSCGKNEMCLVLNSRPFNDGFCVKLNACSRNRPAYISHDKEIPDHRWNCFDFPVLTGFSLLYSVDGIEHRSSSPNICCSEPLGGRCTHGNVTFPLKSCFEHADCFKETHEPKEWCDDKTKLCCSDEVIDKTILCPDGVMYPFHERKCDFYVEKLPTSGVCSYNLNATCLHGHCCPSGYLTSRDSKSYESSNEPIFNYKVTYETNIPCDPRLPLRRISWAFCDSLTGKVVILNRIKFDELTETNGTRCGNNPDCEGSELVCVWGYKEEISSGICIKNPMSILAFNEKFSLSLIISSFVFIFIFAILSVVMKRKWEKK